MQNDADSILKDRHFSIDYEAGPTGDPEAVLAVECPTCGGKTRHRIRGIQAGSKIVAYAACDHTVAFTGGDLDIIQGTVDEMLESLKQIGDVTWTVKPD